MEKDNSGSGFFSKNSDLTNRILFTVFILSIYRLGTYIPLPGIDPQSLQELMQPNQRGLLGMFNIFSGGAVSRMAIFALGIMPYISSSIIIQLLTGVSETFKNLKNQGEIGRKKITQYTRYGTVLLATIPANIINDIPFPIPLCVICSPSHIRKIVPATNVITVVNL